jgi:lipoate-protein ligase A
MAMRKPPAERGVFSATPSGQVLHHAEILVLQQMSDGLKRVADAQDKISDSITDVRDRITKIELAGTAQQLVTLGATLERACIRIDELEGDRDKRSGMSDLVGFAIRATPWLFTLAMGAWAYATKH